ncbi:MAG: hypothetical protein MR673_02615 [Fusobacterium perfoetens]|uniref:hypothetical protein n=1 Tax=Fusobacterium perfoetens TaxID=852 RepID=UPI0023F2E575|nr:hypothetical protein [Fusobacterium perfoetens]MCI6152005.1 hypothetical protein [Fusobacterium perfoetens]MDY3238104.1 hypothetical protein [Fusobacterium perfoetens]
MENYKIKSKINILSKIIDSIFISFSCFVVYFGLKTKVTFSKNSYIIFTILLAIFYGWIFIRDFILYKTMKITHYELIFFYPILRKEVRIKKKDIEKIKFIESEFIPKIHLYYYRVKIIVEDKSYIISSRDYKNFWKILDNIGTKLPKRTIESYRRNTGL